MVKEPEPLLQVERYQLHIIRPRTQHELWGQIPWRGADCPRGDSSLRSQLSTAVLESSTVNKSLVSGGKTKVWTLWVVSCHPESPLLSWGTSVPINANLPSVSWRGVTGKNTLPYLLLDLCARPRWIIMNTLEHQCTWYNGQ